MTEHMSIKIYGGPEAIRGIGRVGDNANENMKEILKRTANHATFWMHIYAPTGDSAYIQRHIAQTGMYWHPGGFGGGGSWEITTGVRRGTSDHPLWVEQGTGLYGEHHSLIHPLHNRAKASVIATGRSRRQKTRINKRAGIFEYPVMTFQKRGEKRTFTPYTRGQQAQPYVRAAYAQAKIYAFTQFKDLFNPFR